MSIIVGVGGSGTYSSASGGKVYAYNSLSPTAQVVAPANTSRKKITFHNPGTINVIVGPSLALLTNAINALLAPLVLTNTVFGGGFLVYANGGTLVIEGECQGAWQALAISSSGQPLTVMDTNI